MTKTVSLDIESYGAIQGQPKQTCFSSRRSVYVDGAKPEHLVQTVAVTTVEDGWHIGDTRVFECRKPLHRKWLCQWIDSAHTIIGQNIPFDISYLRHTPWCRPFLPPFKHKIIELGVLRFLENDQTSQRSLKSLGKALNLYRYERTLSGGYKFKW